MGEDEELVTAGEIDLDSPHKREEKVRNMLWRHEGVW